MPIIAVGTAVGACGMGKKLRQRLGRDEIRLGIDRRTKGFQRHSAPQDLLTRGGIHGDRTARMVQKLRQFAAPHEMHPPRQPMQRGQPSQFAGNRGAAILQRVGFEHQMVGGGGAAPRAKPSTTTDRNSAMVRNGECI